MHLQQQKIERTEGNLKMEYFLWKLFEIKFFNYSAFDITLDELGISFDFCCDSS